MHVLIGERERLKYEGAAVGGCPTVSEFACNNVSFERIVPRLIMFTDALKVVIGVSK